MTIQPQLIAGSEIGLKTDLKPVLLPDQAFSTLENAYVYRERVRRREGFETIGQLRRILSAQAGAAITLTLPSPNTFNLFTNLGLAATEPNASVQPGSLGLPITIVIGAQTLTDITGTGVFTIAPAGNITSATINYATGDVSITFTAGAGPLAVTISMGYFPGLPVMGISQLEQAGINDETTVYFDTKYAYILSGTQFNEFISGTSWDGSDSDFFWTTNYRGVIASDRLFFVTNDFNSVTVPMRYTDQLAWFPFTPQVNNTGTKILQARIIIPYFGRLLLLNTQEGAALGGGSNFFNRCRFSQIGNPVEAYNFAAKTGAFAEDIFGKGGFIDAPTNEAIISAAFIKNTLIVFFERSTWQLRYVGEYGLPFLWERISSDYGSESTFSPVMFDQGILAVGDRAIVTSNAVTVDRIDLNIPDLVFSFLNDFNGVKRVCGVRDFQRELVFWCYPDANSLETDAGQYFPNKVLVYNYRNNTFAIFDDNVTFFGTQQPSGNVTWGRTDIFWGDSDVLWGAVDNQNKFPRIVAGNQQGFVGYYGYTMPDEQSLAIQAINRSVVPNQLTVINHNIQPGEIFQVNNALFTSPGDPGINGNFYKASVIDINTLALQIWTGTTFSDLELPLTGTYFGSGTLTIFPRLNMITKDFNPYMNIARQMFLSYVDFLFDATEGASVSINLFINSSESVTGNLIVGNQELITSNPQPELSASQYVWNRFYCSQYGQFIRFQITYDDTLMTQMVTHEQDMELNALMIWSRPAGKIVF